MKSGFITFLTLAAVACNGAAEALQADGGETAAPAGDPAPKRRGRPPGGGAASAPAGDPNPGDGKSDADRFQDNRALIDPLVKGGQGEDVKKVIAKYSKTGLKDIPAASQADFAKDIEALSY